MKKQLGIAFMLLLAVGLVASVPAMAKVYKIGVTVIVSHPALEADQKGFEKALKEAGIEAEYDYQNAQGEMSNAQAIAGQLHEILIAINTIGYK